MRNDLVDLNPGKAMAQAAHAANQFIACSDVRLSLTSNIEGVRVYNLKEHIIAWQNQAKGFGTTVVLSATKNEIVNICESGKSEQYICETVWDPTYPIRDGDDTITIDVMTCGYVFVSPYTKTYETEFLLRKLRLYP